MYATDSKPWRILCYGDSNTWGWVPSSMGAKRYDKANRWPGVLQTLLGDLYEVIEEGLGARTTMFDDPRPEFPLRNGLESLPIILESHLPLKYVILMLGTTDTKEMFGLNVEEIANGMRQLVRTVKRMKLIEDGVPAKILVVVPPIVKEDADFASKLFRGGTEKGAGLVETYARVAKEEEVFFLNPTNEVHVDPEEGVHLDNIGHRKLAKMIADKILAMN
ncbi:MAG: SGNH/GDSL hydrolase family protein [Candidatus Woesearchaeota archaeon]